MFVRLFFSFVVLISFFLPWIDFGFYSFSGYNLPSSFDKVITINNFFNSQENLGLLKFSYLLYLIPVCACVSILMQVIKTKNNYFFGEFVFGLFGVIILFLYVLSITEEFAGIFGIGFYLTAIASFVGLFLPVNKSNKKIIANSNSNLTSENNNGFSEISIKNTQTELLDELSKLYSLHERGVVDDLKFAERKQSLLSMLKVKENESKF